MHAIKPRKWKIQLSSYDGNLIGFVKILLFKLFIIVEELRYKPSRKETLNEKLFRVHAIFPNQYGIPNNENTKAMSHKPTLNYHRR